MDNGICISSAAVSDRGLSEKRPQNEDSFLEMSKSGIFAVADGVGGAQAGEVASQMAVEILGEAFANFSGAADVESVMRTAIERANAAIYQMAQELPQLANMATTIVALHLAENIATISHVGDSRLYRVDRDGDLYRETADHSMVAEEVRAGRMTEEQAENHPSRNIISRALGAEPTVEVDIKTIMVEPGTSFLICSDGITRHVGDQEIKGVLTFGGDPVDICEYLKGLCYERGAEDNLTAVVVKVTGNVDDAEVSVSRFAMIDEDEPTIATARSPLESTADLDADDTELLELDTREIVIPTTSESSDAEIATNERPAADDLVTEPILEMAPIPVSPDEPEHPAETEIKSPANEDFQQPAQNNTFSMFGDSGEIDSDEIPSSLSKIASAAAYILIGGLLGLGIYYFILAPKPVDTGSPQLSEMRSANIPLSAFEENRRNVDKDPAGYVAKFAANPQDSEDFYLIGRAYLLSGDYIKARSAFTESRNRLGEADPVNVKILASDIAIALAVTNDTTIQSMLKKELDAAKPPANANR